mmetsp:Transcript_98211/g.173963  ORF Transcript_98211/g.173963 Transcript_98211/m.173963 type:complete len:447 (-) Transcript_98211:128-1468(-)
MFLRSVLLMRILAFVLMCLAWTGYGHRPSTRNEKMSTRTSQRQALSMLLLEFSSTPAAAWQLSGQLHGLPASSAKRLSNLPRPLVMSLKKREVLPDGAPTEHAMTESLDRKQFLAAGLGLLVGSAALLESSSEAKAETLAVSAAATKGVDFGAIFQKSATKALGSGKAGAAAAVVQVCSLMWLRTAMNYQYRYGGDLGSVLKSLFDEGGIARLYQGLPFALLQGPLSRFGDTASNIGVLALLDSIPQTAGLPLPFRTAAGSAAAGVWRIFTMPVDTSKTALQVEGKEGWEQLKRRVLEQGPGPLYRGWLASAAATFAGNYPWFLTYNFCDESLPLVSKEDVLASLVRSAFLGLAASCVSDTFSNSLRVIKTTQQTAALTTGDASTASSSGSKTDMSMKEALDLVLETDGWYGLLLRGLGTRLLTNAIQGAAFSVLWKYFQTVLGAQ